MNRAAVRALVGESRRDDLSLLFGHDGVLRGIGLRRETEEDRRPQTDDSPPDR